MMLHARKGGVDWVESRKHQKCHWISRPTVYHASVVIFLEFFAYGLLTAPMIQVLDDTFPQHTLLMNGLILGVKGFLSFLSAPLLGALSDKFGRKPFLLLTVTFTCLPIPFMHLSHWWYFTLLTLSGVFAVTFSVVFAYVADITSEDERNWMYGLVSATFAASLVTSPAIGAYLGRVYGENVLVIVSSSVAILDILFILICVPESLPRRCRLGTWGKRMTWEKVNPFQSLKRIGSDHLILMLCITTFLSYLPEAGEYSCFFVYLRLIIAFSEEGVALFIAVIGVVSCLAQTVVLNLLIVSLGPKKAIIIGLIFEMIQLTCYGFASEKWILWIAGGIAGLGSITYPALSAFVSNHADENQQGVTQGVLTGIRGLCNGLGPALYGFIFYLFKVDLSSSSSSSSSSLSVTTSTTTTTTAERIIISSFNNITSTLLPLLDHVTTTTTSLQQQENEDHHQRLLPGPPFAFGAILVLIAILFTILIPDNPKSSFNISRRMRSLASDDSDKEDPIHSQLQDEESGMIIDCGIEGSSSGGGGAGGSSSSGGGGVGSGSNLFKKAKHNENENKNLDEFQYHSLLIPHHGMSSDLEENDNIINGLDLQTNTIAPTIKGKKTTAQRFIQYWMRWKRESKSTTPTTSSTNFTSATNNSTTPTTSTTTATYRDVKKTSQQQHHLLHQHQLHHHHHHHHHHSTQKRGKNLSSSSSSLNRALLTADSGDSSDEFLSNSSSINKFDISQQQFLPESLSMSSPDALDTLTDHVRTQQYEGRTVMNE